MPPLYLIGVDVGTGSVRAALVNSSGKVLKSCSKEIKIFKSAPGYYEQSSNNIWESLCYCVKDVSQGYSRQDIVGIGFDATCSLVLLDKDLNPLAASTENNEQNIILWMDHRAGEEQNFINDTKHEMLKFVGGKISLEMEIPKLLWIKRNRPESFAKIGFAFDLPDFLTFKCTGSNTRSVCSVTCKWNFDANNMSWSEDYLDKIGLSELKENGYVKIGSQILFPGDSVPGNLSSQAAEDLGLFPGIAVGTSMIDAHSGAIGLIGAHFGNQIDLTKKLVLIAGTSTCHMSISEEPLLAEGIWGPYKHALLPNFYLNEAGQSATGILIDHVIVNHPAFPAAKSKLKKRTIYEYLNESLENLAKERKLKSYHELTRDLHVWPDFHGNRSPLSDSNLKGMISGLTMENDEENLAILYLATVQALTYGTKHIIETLYKEGRKEHFESILICGGLSKNQLFVQTHADVCSVPVLVPTEPESVLVGAAMLGAAAAKLYPNLECVIKEMSSPAIMVQPNSNRSVFKYHQKKYQVFLKMVADQKSYDQIMDN